MSVLVYHIFMAILVLGQTFYNEFKKNANKQTESLWGIIASIITASLHSNPSFPSPPWIQGNVREGIKSVRYSFFFWLKR